MPHTLMLLDNIEELFASGEDDIHTKDELVELLKDVKWSMLIHAIIHKTAPVYAYTVDGPKLYRGPKLLAETAFRLYQDAPPAETVRGITYQRSLELWISENLDLFVTSCFRISAGDTSAEYRAWKGYDWRKTDMEIDFSVLASNLAALSELPSLGNIPFYEGGVVV